MVVQRRVKKQHNFLKIIGVALIVLCIVGLVIVVLGSLAAQFL